MIQTLALENVADPELNPGFDPHQAFFESPRGLETRHFARARLARYRESEDFTKVITFRLMSSWCDQLTPDWALLISHPKLGKRPVTALLISLTPLTHHTLQVKARVR